MWHHALFRTEQVGWSKFKTVAAHVTAETDEFWADRGPKSSKKTLEAIVAEQSAARRGAGAGRGPMQIPSGVEVIEDGGTREPGPGGAGSGTGVLTGMEGDWAGACDRKRGAATMSGMVGVLGRFHSTLIYFLICPLAPSPAWGGGVVLELDFVKHRIEAEHVYQQIIRDYDRFRAACSEAAPGSGRRSVRSRDPKLVLDRDAIIGRLMDVVECFPEDARSISVLSSIIRTSVANPGHAKYLRRVLTVSESPIFLTHPSFELLVLTLDEVPLDLCEPLLTMAISKSPSRRVRGIASLTLARHLLEVLLRGADSDRGELTAIELQVFSRLEQLLGSIRSEYSDVRLPLNGRMTSLGDEAHGIGRLLRGR